MPRADSHGSAPARSWSSAPAARRRPAIILDAMRDAGTAELYVPIDVSATFLGQTAARLRREYPRLLVEPAIADISEELNLPRRLPRPALLRLPRQHDRELLSAGGDPAALAGARGDAAG